MKNIYEIVVDLLKSNERYLSEDGNLLKTKVYSDAMTMNKELIEILLKNDDTRKNFFVEINNNYVFDKQGFAWFVEEKEFLPDSYTKYTNKIGLKTDGKYINQNNNVVIDFPFKDCVLEGGQTKEDQKKDEIFFNEIIASNEITNMLSPKIFSSAKRYSKNRIENNIKYNNDNLLIKGNNLISIASLLPKYENSIKLIYIDPPYNTGSDTFSYNDSFNRSSWLVFMKNRLEIAKKLLAPDGAIYVQLDYHQVHYCKVLMDEIFGENNFQREIIWRIGWVSGHKCKDNNWIRNHDTILFYSKNNTSLKFNKMTIPNEEFKDCVADAQLSKIAKQFGLSDKNIKVITNYLNHESRPEKYYIEDVWNANEYDNLNSIAILSFSGETVSKMLNADDIVKGQKSEKLIERIINAHTKPGDIVLDFFGGTGTTAAVAMKMNRKFIVCEQLDKHVDIAVRRLNKVIQGEKSGVSNKNNWQGGGSFVYCELKENGQELINKVLSADEKSIHEIKEEIINDDRIISYITKNEIKEANEEFNGLSLEEKKKALISLIDKNKLYVNYSDMNDINYNVTEEEKSFTKSFYEGV